MIVTKKCALLRRVRGPQYAREHVSAADQLELLAVHEHAAHAARARPGRTRRRLETLYTILFYNDDDLSFLGRQLGY